MPGGFHAEGLVEMQRPTCRPSVIGDLRYRHQPLGLLSVIKSFRRENLAVQCRLHQITQLPPR